MSEYRGGYVKFKSSFGNHHSWSSRACYVHNVHHWPKPVISHPKYHSCLCLACTRTLWLFWILFKKTRADEAKSHCWLHWHLAFRDCSWLPVVTEWPAAIVRLDLKSSCCLLHFHPKPQRPFSFFFFSTIHIHLCFCVQRIEPLLFERSLLCLVNLSLTLGNFCARSGRLW